MSVLTKDLLDCGDIESNPGPTEKEMLRDLLAGQGKMQSSIDAITVSQADIERKMSALADRVDGIEKQLSTMNALSGTVKELEANNVKLSKQLTTLEAKIDELENRGRRNNLIIYGLTEIRTETTETLTKAVSDEVFQLKLGVSVNGIERIHRLGQKAENKVRPVIINFLDHREKVSILKAAYKLKNSDLSISEDFSRRVRDIRRQLWQTSTTERAKGAKVKLSYDKLILDGVTYGWDDIKKSRYRIKNKIRN